MHCTQRNKNLEYNSYLRKLQKHLNITNCKNNYSETMFMKLSKYHLCSTEQLQDNNSRKTICVFDVAFFSLVIKTRGIKYYCVTDVPFLFLEAFIMTCEFGQWITSIKAYRSIKRCNKKKQRSRGVHSAEYAICYGQKPKFAV